MRRLFFILMIALLPLRGWAGEAMATQMAIHAAQNNAKNLIVNNSINTLSTAISSFKTPDCEIHASAPAEKANAATDVTEDSSHTCTHCQACHAVGITNLALNRASYSAVNALPEVQIKRFASADLALRQKPPIL